MQFGKVLISASLAFFMSIAVACLIETFGGAVGSVIGTVPSTILPAAYILMTEESKTIEQRTESLLACVFGVFATNMFFMPSWKLIPPKLPKTWSNKKIVVVTSVLSLLVWFVVALAATYLQSFVKGYGFSMWAFTLLVMCFMSACGIILCWRLPPTPAGKNKVKWYVNLSRGIGTFIVMFISGILSQTDAGAVAGTLTTFPAIFLTTMVSVSLAQGGDVVTGAIGPLMIGGMSVGWFSPITGACFAVLHLHAFWCCLIGFVVSVLFWSIPVYYYVRWRRDATALKTKRMVEEAAAEAQQELEMKEVKPGVSSENETKAPDTAVVIAPSQSSS